ncbi:trypsin-like serine peptidase [Janthinobacterium sp. HLX7-2]|uniref:trypsin-like serine peptidase n=1 Tax=Janthinobacterium sp. HLX7-2 TaxID=1259331 RepID=UPI003F1F3390
MKSPQLSLLAALVVGWYGAPAIGQVKSDGYVSTGVLKEQIDFKKSVKNLTSVEHGAIANVDAQTLKMAPLLGSNGNAPVTELRPSDIPPVALSKTLMRLSDQQRSTVSVLMQDDIARLTMQLAELLAKDAKTPTDLEVIDELNKTLTVKRQARDFTLGNPTVVSNAAAESFTNTSNPFFLICGNTLWTRNDPLRWVDMVTPQRNALIEAGKSVGLLSVKDRPAGTAFVVGKSHVITNMHVVQIIADFDEKARLWRVKPDVKIKFNAEYPLGAAGNCPVDPVPTTYFVNGVFAVPPKDDKDDVAILLTSTDAQFPKPLKVHKRDPKQYAGNMVVAIIGYPGPPSDMTPSEQIQFFSTPDKETPQFVYKRLSEGFSGDDAVTSEGFFVHKANTAGGNSGSPIFDLKNGEVVGIHVAGRDRFNSVMGYNLGLVGERVANLIQKAGL